jgi:hypothetical protein
MYAKYRQDFSDYHIKTLKGKAGMEYDFTVPKKY